MPDIITTHPGQVPATAADMADIYRQYADAYAATERSGGSSISVRNGVMSIGDQPVPGNQFAAVILDAVRLNTFYRNAFNPAAIEAPTCYAVGRSDPEMSPHPDMAKDPTYFQPQADRCGACPHNEFGSGRTGTGKACTNRRRLLLLPAGHYQQGPNGFVLQPIQDTNHYSESPFLTLNLAPTTLASYGAWIRDTAANYQRPMFGVIARVFLYQHPKHGKEAIGFETLAPTPDEWGPIIFKRHQQATTEIMEGYEVPDASTQQHNHQQRGGGFQQQQQQQQQQYIAPGQPGYGA